MRSYSLIPSIRPPTSAYVSLSRRGCSLSKKVQTFVSLASVAFPSQPRDAECNKNTSLLMHPYLSWFLSMWRTSESTLESLLNGKASKGASAINIENCVLSDSTHSLVLQVRSTGTKPYYVLCHYSLSCQQDYISSSRTRRGQSTLFQLKNI